LKLLQIVDAPPFGFCAGQVAAGSPVSPIAAITVFGEVKYCFRGKVYGCSWRRTFSAQPQ
jgi:hypothetical protein